MAVLAGIQQTVKDTGTIVRSVAKDCELLSPSELPVLSAVTGGSVKRPRVNNLPSTYFNLTADRIEWYADTMRPTFYTLNAASTAGTTALTIASPVTNALHLTKGTILESVSTGEQVLVTTAGDASGNVTVARAFAGTTGATIPTTANDLRVVGRAIWEGDDFATDSFITKDNYVNYWQGFYGTVGGTLKERALDRYGVSGADAIADQEKKTLLQVMKELEYAVIYGRGQLGTGSAVPSTMHGLRGLMPAANVTNVAGALTASAVDTVLENLFNAGGDANTPDTVLVNGKGKNIFTRVYGQGYVNLNRDETKHTAGYSIDRVQVNLGTLDIIASPYINSGECYFFKKDSVGVGPLDNLEFSVYDLPVTGPRVQRAIYGEYTMVCTRPSAIWRMYAFT